ncbi:MAG: hypothetical protein Q9187_001570 [Circinaria calcarea]
MADEVRRSGRATKGQHTKNVEEAEVPTPKRGGKSSKAKATKQTSTEASPPADNAEDAIIRCICGYVEEDEDDDRTMVICDKCEAWQHNECMEISENSEDLPEQYYCELCRPQDHKDLLAKVARGEKPWEERAKQRELEAEARKARRRKGGKKGKKGRPSEIQVAKSEVPNSNGTPAKEPSPKPASPKQPVVRQPVPKLPLPTPPLPPLQYARQAAVLPTPELSQKRKLSTEETVSTTVSIEQEPLNKIRKVSSPKEVKPPPQRRKSSALMAPVRSDSKGEILQTELVENISELRSDARQKAAGALVKMFVDQTKQAQKQGTFKVPPGQTLDAFGLRLGLAVEYAIYLNYWGHAGEPNSQYKEKLMMMLHNIKANPTLRDRILNGSLSPNELSKMSSFDMASKELQEKTAEMKKEAEKQHMLIQEEGPRIRRTHKGEEIVGDDSQHLMGTDSVFSNVPSRRREGEIDGSAQRHSSPDQMSPRSPNTVELPNDVAMSGMSRSPPSSRTLSLDTRITPRPSWGSERKSSSATFNIQNVWSSVDTPSAEKQPARQLPPAYPSNMLSEPSAAANVQADPDIDQLLKDEEPDEEEPYSPTDYEAEPGVIWRGNMVMASVADFAGTAKHVAGANLSAIHPWSQLMPPTLSIEGRIDIEKASNYLCGLQWSKTTDVSVVAVTPNDNVEDDIKFKKLFAYFTERKRYGVIGHSPDGVVRDIYVVPLEAGMSKKPDFVELLEYCNIEDPRPSRMLLVAYVIKPNRTDAPSSAQATPRHQDSAAVNSPMSAQAPGQYRPPYPIGNPGSHTSPAGPYSGAPAPSYGSPAQPQQPFAAPQPQNHNPYPNPPQPNMNLRGIEAARLQLGDMANCPAVNDLLAQAPNTGVVEFGFIKEVFDSVPASRNDFSMLMGLLTMRSQQQQGGS